MTTSYKILGQAALASTTNTDVYTVPQSTQSVVSSIVIANRGSSSATYRIAVRPSAESISNKHYIAYDVTVGALDSTSISLGITLSEADIITLYSSSSNISVSIFGSEIY